MFSVQRCSGRLLVQCVMYFLKQRLKVWKILEKKLKQNLEVLRSDLSKLKVATESAAGYVVYKPTSRPANEYNICISRHIYCMSKYMDNHRCKNVFTFFI